MWVNFWVHVRYDSVLVIQSFGILQIIFRVVGGLSFISLRGLSMHLLLAQIGSK